MSRELALCGIPEPLCVGADGCLYRRGSWSAPIRENYSCHRRIIETVADLKATLRAGQYAWPGGYAIYFVTADGAALSFGAVRSEFASIVRAIRANDRQSGWRIVATCSTADDDETPVCDHAGRTIE